MKNNSGKIEFLKNISMKVSIITPTFNSKNTIKECLQSIKAQTYDNIEHIIIDGKSTDETLDIVRKYSPNSIILSEKDNGIYDALNKGIAIASGEIIGILHSDDIYAYEDVIKDVVDIFKNKKVDSCYGDLCYVNTSNPPKIIRYWKAGNYNINNFRFGWMPPHPTFFVKKDLYQKYGLFDLSYKISSDYDLMVRFLYEHKISTAYLPKVLIKMRIGGESNKNLQNIFLKMLEDYKIIKKHKLGGVGTLLLKNFRKLPQFIISKKFC